MATNWNDDDFRWPEKFSEIPKEAFHREDIYRAELERIYYGPEWHLLAHVSEVPEPGDFKTIDLGEAPMLILRGDDGEIRVFENSCPHRGTQLETRARGNVPRRASDGRQPTDRRLHQHVDRRLQRLRLGIW